MTTATKMTVELAKQIQEAFGPCTGIYEAMTTQEIINDFNEAIAEYPATTVGDWAFGQIASEKAAGYLTNEAAKKVEATLTSLFGKPIQMNKAIASLLERGYKKVGSNYPTKEEAVGYAKDLRKQGYKAEYQRLGKDSFTVFYKEATAKAQAKQPNEAGFIIDRDAEIGRLAIQRRTDSPYGEDTVEIQFPNNTVSGLQAEVEITTASWRGTIEQTEEFARQLLVACKLARKGV